MPRAIKLKFVQNLRVKPRKQTSPSRAPCPDEHDDDDGGVSTRDGYAEYLRNEIRCTPPDLTSEKELLCSELRGISRRK